MKHQAMVDRLMNVPRGQSESEWLDVIDFLVKKLGDATGGHLHLGSYWFFDSPNPSSAGFGSRVRSRYPLKGVKSDYWEAALCYIGGAEQTFVDAMVFPFLENRPMTEEGKLAAGDVFFKYRNWHWKDGQFVDEGWTASEGPGEWEWIERPGDEYLESVDIQFSEKVFEQDHPVLATISGVSLPKSPMELKNSTGRISLVHANRSRENTNLYPWGNHPARPSCRRAIPIQEVRIEDSMVVLDLTRFKIRGGWKPGTYHIALRVQNFHDPNDNSFSSDISKPFKLTIR